MMNSFTEENYLKAIYKLNELNTDSVSTNAIAEKLNTKAASVTDMLKKLAEKKLINYQKYQGVSLTAAGNKVAIKVIRKHRLWEFFLVNTLKFKWDEVHDMAEELEHINSEELVLRLDNFLGNPKFDPHGDPIPDANGKFSTQKNKLLANSLANESVTMTGVVDHSAQFLQYLDKTGISLGDKIKIQEVNDYDKSFQISINNKKIYLSNEVAKNILVAS